MPPFSALTEIGTEYGVHPTCQQQHHHQLHCSRKRLQCARLESHTQAGRPVAIATSKTWPRLTGLTGFQTQVTRKNKKKNMKRPELVTFTAPGEGATRDAAVEDAYQTLEMLVESYLLAHNEGDKDIKHVSGGMGPGSACRGGLIARRSSYVLCIADSKRKNN